MALMHGMVTPRVMIVTASDSRFMPFLRGMLQSIEPCLAQPGVNLACFDIGLTVEDKAWLEQLGATVTPPRTHLGVQAAEHDAALLSFLARPFLPSYFPGYDVYVWIDSDVWLQDPAVFNAYVSGAMQHGMAITHERERSYRFQPWLFGWTTKHFLLGYGLANTAYLLSRKHVNAGFFAIHADAPHWAAWARRYEAAIARSGNLVPHDQFALNQALHAFPASSRKLETCLLDPLHNWICERGVPMWRDDLERFCEPRAPFRPIGAMHLAGPAKRTRYTIRRSGGGSFVTALVNGARPESPALAPL
jgi:hypothetical protein